MKLRGRSRRNGNTCYVLLCVEGEVRAGYVVEYCLLSHYPRMCSLAMTTLSGGGGFEITTDSAPLTREKFVLGEGGSQVIAFLTYVVIVDDFEVLQADA